MFLSITNVCIHHVGGDASRTLLFARQTRQNRKLRARGCSPQQKMSCPQTMMETSLLLSFMLVRYLIALGWWNYRSKRNLILGIILSTSSRSLAEGTPIIILLIWESCHILGLTVSLPYLR
eukprot:GEMP01086736.1.p1 GENE.GEMP01086736.1~~GEMP01086736.1.p1  ORF type:complete len:121 (+),score=9.64 GEMP01086736.1:190-552(+)